MRLWAFFFLLPVSASAEPRDAVHPQEQVNDPIRQIELDEFYNPIPDLSPPGKSRNGIRREYRKEKKRRKRRKTFTPKEQRRQLRLAVKRWIAARKNADDTVPVTDPVDKSRLDLEPFGLAKVGRIGEVKGKLRIFGRLDFENKERGRITLGFEVRPGKYRPKVLRYTILRENGEHRPKKAIRWLKK